MAILKEDMIKSVAPIGVDINGKIVWVATCFFVASEKHKENGYDIPFLITNKHVINFQKNIYIRIKALNEQGFIDTKIELYDNLGKPKFKSHKTDDIDIIALKLDCEFLKRFYDFTCVNIDNYAMDSKMLLTEGVSEGSLALMLGYPMSEVVETSSCPICRQGCVARIDMEEVKLKHYILFDIQSFPGNSGSPIYLRPELNSVIGTKNILKPILMGVVSKYKLFIAEMKNMQTGNIEEIKHENSGITIVYPVEYIKETIELYYKE